MKTITASHAEAVFLGESEMQMDQPRQWVVMKFGGTSVSSADCWKTIGEQAKRNIEAGKRVEGNIYLLDILPTVCDLAGIDIPENVQGTSFKPVLEGIKSSVRDVMYGVYCGGSKPGMRCVKKGDWKLIKCDLMDGTIRETQLFNLAENPNEYLPEHQKSGKLETNLADNPKYADKLAEMETLLLEQMEINGDPYRLWNQIK